MDHRRASRAILIALRFAAIALLALIVTFAGACESGEGEVGTASPSDASTHEEQGEEAE